MRRERVEKNLLTADEAKSMVNCNLGYVHTFTNRNGVVIGAEWTLIAVHNLIEAGVCKRSGDVASSMGHGLAVFLDNRWIFVATKGGAE